jgi:hypothetical protein
MPIAAALTEDTIKTTEPMMLVVGPSMYADKLMAEANTTAI